MSNGLYLTLLPCGFIPYLTTVSGPRTGDQGAGTKFASKGVGEKKKYGWHRKNLVLHTVLRKDSRSWTVHETCS
jgi:hypothetical protein